MNNKKEVIRMIKFMLFSISAGAIEGIFFEKQQTQRRRHYVIK